MYRVKKKNHIFVTNLHYETEIKKIILFLYLKMFILLSYISPLSYALFWFEKQLSQIN